MFIRKQSILALFNRKFICSVVDILHTPTITFLLL